LEESTSIKKILLLGGTEEASKISNIISQDFPEISVINSLAGLTKNPKIQPGKIIKGGFGGELGLRKFIISENINLIINATHPFAEKISQSVFSACQKNNIPCVHLRRPPWKLNNYKKISLVKDMESAAKIIKISATRVFVTTGTHDLNVFKHFNNIWFLIRFLEPPLSIPLIENHNVVIGSPPFSLNSERNIFERYKINCLLSKNSGGGATQAKITVAQELNIPIILLNRPVPPTGTICKTVGGCIKWLKSRVK